MPMPVNDKLSQGGRKFTMAYSALWLLGGLTLVLFLALVISHQYSLASTLGQTCIGAISGLLGIYFSSQAYVDKKVKHTHNHFPTALTAVTELRAAEPVVKIDDLDQPIVEHPEPTR